MDAVANHACRISSHLGSTETDLVVSGPGCAGFSAAIRGAELGANVALIGHGTIGGICVNIGCLPSKTLIRAADALHQAEAASRFAALSAAAHLADWSALVAQKDDLVAGSRRTKYEALLGHYKAICYVEGAARTVPPGLPH